MEKQTFEAPVHTAKRLTSDSWLTVFYPKKHQFQRAQVHEAVAPCGLEGIIVFKFPRKMNQPDDVDFDFWSHHSFYSYALKKLLGQ